MILLLNEHRPVSREVGGRLGSDLSRLAYAKVPIIPTVLINKEAFASYNDGNLSDSVFEETLSLFSNISETDLLVRASLPDDAIWCENNIRVGRNTSALRNAVERIFRSITTPRSRASRTVLRISDDEAVPAILVQSLLQPIWRVLSRHAVTGVPTDEKNWRDNVNNELPEPSSVFIDLSRRAEALLGAPVHVFFSAMPQPAIARVDTAMMTESGRLAALVDLFVRGIIDRLNVIRQLQPWMFGHLQGFEIDPSRRIEGATGIAASPGQVFGRVALRRFGRRHPGDLPPVFFVVEAAPDDIDDIDESVASVGSTGGLSSHLAVICRGMAKPCVVGTGIVIDDRKRILVLKSGRQIKEHSSVVVDGTYGGVDFTDSPNLVPKYLVVQHKRDVQDVILKMIREQAESGEFRRLSIQDQTQIASLKLRLRELKIIQ